MDAVGDQIVPSANFYVMQVINVTFLCKKIEAFRKININC
jgi:hypothetical protein